MAEQLHEEKTARHLDRLSEALDSGTQYQVRHLLMNLSAAEIGDLLESLPIAKRLAVWELKTWSPLLTTWTWTTWLTFSMTCPMRLSARSSEAWTVRTGNGWNRSLPTRRIRRAA